MNNEVFVNFVCVLGIIPFVVYLLNRKVSIETKCFLPFIFLLAFASFYEFLGTDIFKINTSYWFRLYSLLEFCTVWYFYFKFLQYKKTYIFYGIIYLALFCFLLINWSPSSREMNDLPLNIAITLLVLVSSFLWFLDVFKKGDDKPLYLRPEFYYVSALLIYFTGTFWVFLMTDYIINDDSIKLLDYWVLIVIFNLILRVTLIFAVWKAQIKSIH